MARAPEDTWSFPPGPGDLDPFDIGSGRLGVLLIHGFGGTPPEMRGLGEHLAARGFRVRGTLLAGHGTTPEDHDRSTWRDWVGSARTDLERLKSECDMVFVAGQSMGGAISLYLAANDPDIRAVATTAAAVRLRRRTVVMIAIGRRVQRWHRPDRTDIDLFEPQNVSMLRSYNRNSMRSLSQLVTLMRATRSSLPAIKAPVLVLHGARDRSILPETAALVANRVGGPTTVRIFPRSGHGMTVDVDREEVYALVAAHFRAVAGIEAPVSPPDAARVTGAPVR